MPTVNGRGYSEFTPDKETGYEKIMIQHLAIVNQIQKNWVAKKWTGMVKYYHIDCTSGPGRNPEVSCDGSPTITKRLLAESKLWYRICCIEENPKSFSNLYKTLEPYNTNSQSGKISCIGGNYKIEIYNILNSIRDKNPYGLIYIDENTYPDWDIVESISI